MRFADKLAHSAGTLLQDLKERLQNRPDTEHEIAYNRIAISCLALIYSYTITHFDLFTDVEPFSHYIWLFVAHNGLGLLILAHILWKPQACPARRIAGIVVDVSMIVYFMESGNEAFLFMYPFLLWAIFGNGFRFGTKYLFIASAYSVALFAALLHLSPFWQRYPALSAGGLLGLVILPAYVSVLIRKLSDAIEAAEQANRAKSLFLASISHELRTPLNAIIGLSGLMKSTRLDAEQAGMVRTIGEAGRSLLSLINSVLDLSRMEAGKMPLSEDQVDIYALLARIRNILGVIAEGKGLHLSLQISANVPQYVIASERQIEEIVTNLVSNAVKFTEKGYVFVRVGLSTMRHSRMALTIEVKDTGIGIAKEAQERIFDRFTQADEKIVDRFGGTGLGLAIAKQMAESSGGRIVVKSQPGVGSTFTVTIGVGMPASKDPAPVFDGPAFLFSADESLRLSLAESVPGLTCFGKTRELEAALHGTQKAGSANSAILFLDLDCPADPVHLAGLLGERPRDESVRIVAINRHEDDLIDDALGQYFVSVLDYPFDNVEVGNALRIAVPDDEANRQVDQENLFRVKTKARILVADDNRTNQMVVGKILERAGHTVVFANDGQAALELLTGEHFDIAFMDINMPVMNGLEAARLYNFACLGTVQTPIFAFTADVTEATRQKCLSVGMEDCVSKPIEPAELLALIDQRLMDACRIEEVRQDAELVDTPATSGQQDLPDGPIDFIALGDLEELGGKQFVREIVDQFIDDTTDILAGLARAVETQNYRAFRDELHALRSGAANIGARDVFQSCLTWREIDPEELAVRGDRHLESLRRQIDEVRAKLTAHLNDRSASGFDGGAPGEREPDRKRA
ncbi:MAG: ATP-binding protein [Beijerinckiaceae bacterium]